MILLIINIFYSGDVVHVVGDFDKTNTCIIDDENNYLIVRPDVLVSSTHISFSFDCQRRSILQERVRVENETNASMVYGNILHELFQRCLEYNNFSTKFCKDESETIITKQVENLYGIGESETTAKNHVMEFIPLIQSWAGTYFHQETPKVMFKVDICYFDFLKLFLKLQN